MLSVLVEAIIQQYNSSGRNHPHMGLMSMHTRRVSDWDNPLKTSSNQVFVIVTVTRDDNAKFWNLD